MILALPVAKVLKDKKPDILIAMLGKKYTKPVALASKYADAFIDADDFYTKDVFINDEKPQGIVILNTDMNIARRAHELKIPIRIGTGRNFVFIRHCNYPVWFSRRKSGLHEAQLNLKLLRPFGFREIFSKEFIADAYGLNKLQPLQKEFALLITPGKFNVIIHTKSQGNAREWSMQHFIKLVQMLDENIYNIFISGTEKERPFIQPLLNEVANKVTDIIGTISLEQFMPFVNCCDAVVSNSTGPLHIAAALGINAIGIYPPIKTRDAGRWGPVGKKAFVFTLDKFCELCKYNKDNCTCINSIKPVEIKLQLDKLVTEKIL